jgi:alginate O-acetyltransferase complex protein AlgI
MLFNSLPFFAFLGLVLTAVGLAVRLRVGRDLRIAAVGLASTIFYAYWDLHFTALLAASIGGNYLLGHLLHRRRRRSLLIVGVALNLLLIAVFKYAGFAVSSLNAMFDAALPDPQIVLPLGISFYTFEQIAYLTTAYRNGSAARQPRPGEYVLFVTFFPHLIAGPIIQPLAFFQQTGTKQAIAVTAGSLAAGLSLFVIGLGKKVLIADNLAPHVAAIFDSASALRIATFTDAWSGALLYAFQIYFDFSGYSDMAVGLALALGILLPFNFNSPYRAMSIIDFWRRWHMSLSTFLRDYLYIPLGGNQCSFGRQLCNIMIVMLLGGLWHGAGWTFVAWGAGHGLLLVINHCWRRLRPSRERSPASWRWMAPWVTFLCVVMLWVTFRAGTFDAALAMYGGMFGVYGVLPADYLPAWAERAATQIPSVYDRQSLLQFAATLAVLYVVCVAAPNSQRIVLGDGAGSQIWHPSPRWALTLGGVGLLVLISIYVGRPSEFLYFQF